MTQRGRPRSLATILVLVVAAGICFYFRSWGSLSGNPETVVGFNKDGATVGPNARGRGIVPPTRSPVVRTDRRPLDVPAPCAIRLSGATSIEIAQAELFAIEGGEVSDEPLAGADGNGRLELPSASQLPALLMLSVPGAAHTVIETSCPGLLTVPLRPEAKISGVVRVRESDVPAAGADVVLELGRAKLRTKTTPTGEFSFSGVPAGLHSLLAEAHGLRGVIEFPLVLVEGTHVKNAHIYLDKAYTLFLQIKTGGVTSFEKFGVRVKSSRGGSITSTRLSEDRFSIGPLSSGQYQLLVSSDDRRCTATMLHVDSALSVTNDEQEVVVDVGPRYQVTIVGTDADGQPAARIPLDITQEILRKDGFVDKHNRTTSTDLTGTALICGVASGALVVEAQGKTHALKVPQQAKLHVQGLEGDSLLYGSIVSSEGLPVAAKDLFLIAPEAPGSGRTSQSNAAGRFQFEHVLPGAYKLEVRSRLVRPGELPTSQDLAQRPELSEAIEIRKNEDLEAELILPPMDSSRISGRVMSSEGSAVSGAMITYGVDGGACWPSWDAGFGSTFSDADGRFSLPDVESAVPLRVHALHPALGRGSVGEVTPGGMKEVTIRLSTLATLEVQASAISAFTPLSSHCIVEIVDVPGCVLAGIQLPSDGSSAVIHDLPSTAVIVSLVCPRAKETPSVHTTLTASQVAKVDLLPHRP